MSRYHRRGSWFSRNKFTLLFVAFVVFVGLPTLYFTTQGWIQCSNEGGAYVRDAFGWYVCIK